MSDLVNRHIQNMILCYKASCDIDKKLPTREGFKKYVQTIIDEESEKLNEEITKDKLEGL